jgi:DNA topoisomerase IB
LRLIRATAFRNGGDDNTGDVKAYGASNLSAKHVSFDGDTTNFDFTGKLGVRQQHSLTDPEITADLKRRSERGGRLFNTDDGKVRAYLKQAGGDFKVHDFRTWNATNLAKKLVTPGDAPNTAKRLSCTFEGMRL